MNYEDYNTEDNFLSTTVHVNYELDNSPITNYIADTQEQYYSYYLQIDRNQLLQTGTVVAVPNDIDKFCV